jgi:hypothetical protein
VLKPRVWLYNLTSERLKDWSCSTIMIERDSENGWEKINLLQFHVVTVGIEFEHC